LFAFVVVFLYCKKLLFTFFAASFFFADLRVIYFLTNAKEAAVLQRLRLVINDDLSFEMTVSVSKVNDFRPRQEPSFSTSFLHNQFWM
jgi:hypothetical protein